MIAIGSACASKASLLIDEIQGLSCNVGSYERSERVSNRVDLPNQHIHRSFTLFIAEGPIK